MDNTKGKLPLSVKLGYAVGTVGDSVPYNLFFTYFLFYLTDVAGISPAIAGIIAFVSNALNAVADPVVGYLSDNSKNPKGRRRTWMIKSVWPLSIVLVLLFMPNSLTDGLQAVYYTVMALLLWVLYAAYVLPWTALGAEITQDYNERNILRMYGGIIAYIFVAVCNSGPMFILGAMIPRGLSEKECWGITGALAAVIIIVLALVSVRATRGREIKVVQDVATMGNILKGLLTQYKELLKVKLYRTLVLVCFIYTLGFTIFNATGVYMLTYSANLSPPQQGTFWVMYTVFAMLCVPVPVFIANRIGKKKTLIGFTFLFTLNTVVFFFIGFASFAHVLVFAFFVALGTSAFWGLFFSIAYDVAEVIQYIYGNRREGGILALIQFFQKFGGAIATSIAGALLGMFGYMGPGLQSPETLQGILMLSTIIPGIIAALSMLVMLKFPLNKVKFDLIKNAIEARENGQEYSDEGFKDCL